MDVAQPSTEDVDEGNMIHLDGEYTRSEFEKNQLAMSARE